MLTSVGAVSNPHAVGSSIYQQEGDELLSLNYLASERMADILVEVNLSIPDEPVADRSM